MKYIAGIMYSVIILAVGFFSCFFSCSGFSGLTKENKIAKQIDSESSVSSMIADCLAKNAGIQSQQGGANLRNCDIYIPLYKRLVIYNKCNPIANKTDRDFCIKFLAD